MINNVSAYRISMNSQASFKSTKRIPISKYVENELAKKYNSLEKSKIPEYLAKELDRMYAQIAKNLAAINIKVEKGEMTLNEALDATQKLQDSTLLKKIIKFETYKTLLKIKNKDTI